MMSSLAKEVLRIRRQLFKHLDMVEGILGKQRYLTGERVTEADIRLFMTLIRFDEVRRQVGHDGGRGCLL